MGTYIFSQKEIEEEFKVFLDDLSGDVIKKDVERAVEKVISKYKHFSK